MAKNIRLLELSLKQEMCKSFSLALAGFRVIGLACHEEINDIGSIYRDHDVSNRWACDSGSTKSESSRVNCSDWSYNSNRSKLSA